MSKNNYFISAFGTFGNPNGFRQSFFFIDNSLSNIAKNVGTFDLNTVAIKLFPQSRVYALRKEFINSSNVISFSIYTFAKEQNSDRGGTFIGSSIIFKDKVAEESIIIDILEDFHNNLEKSNVHNESIIVNHSENLTVSKPKDFDKINFHLKETEKSSLNQNSNKKLLVFTTTNRNDLCNILKKSTDLLGVYNTIYFTQSEDVAKFVAQKGVFKFIQQVGEKKEFDQEIEKLQAERKQRITNEILNLKNQKQKFEEEERRELENLKNKNDKNEQEHYENSKKIQESKDNLAKIKNLYQNFSSKFSVLISGLESGKQLAETQNSYKQFEKEFNEEKRKLSSNTQISSLSNARSSAQVSTYSNPYEKPYYGNNEDAEKNSTSKVLTIISLILNVLLIGGITYLYFINDKNEKKIANTENIAASNEESDFNESDSVLVESKLNPIPNDAAKNKIDDIKNKLIDNSTKIDEVVKIIFEINKPVRDIYKYQKGDYEEYLIQENPSAFDSNKVLIKKDSLTKIPFYKDDNMKNELINSTISTK